MSLLPLRGEASTEPDEPQVLGLDGEDADEAFDVLSSSTTREVLSFVYDQPSTPAEIRDEIGTSLQNVHYHIDKLEEADLIEPAGTGYSEKGTEMTIYAPSNEAVVLFAGRESDRSRLGQMLGRVFGVVFALAAGTLLYDRFLLDRAGQRTSEFAGGQGDGDDGGGDPGAMDAGGNGSDGGATTTAEETAGGGGDGGDGGGLDAADAETTPTSEPMATEAATEGEAGGTAVDVTSRVAEQAAEPTPVDVVTTALADPAAAFLLGGVLALTVAGVVWYASR